MILALLGALLIGLSLGLLGSGGSILTVPALHYLAGHPEKQAIAESLAIVGGIALVGAMQYAVSGLVSWRHVVYFGLPGMIGAYLGAQAAAIVTGQVQLAIFALIMLAASFMVMRRPKVEPRPEATESLARQAPWIIGLNGVAVGALTGFIGIGGGFIIVPALLLLGRLPLRVAIGTSLCIIAMNAFAGFGTHLRELPEQGYRIDWTVIGAFLGLGVAGSFAGSFIGARIDQRTLRRTFGWLLLAMGVYILARQLWPDAAAASPSHTMRARVGDASHVQARGGP